MSLLNRNAAMNQGMKFLERGRIPAIDGCRGIAVLLVVLTHAAHTRYFPDWIGLNSLARHGAIGVEVFFVISGFLITTLLMREADRTGQIDLRKFYARRSLRIMPAYVCLLAVLAIAGWFHQIELRPQDWIAACTYTVNFLKRPTWEIGHAWSLSIEEHFYLLWPILLAYSARGAVWMSVGCMGICFAGRWVVLLFFPEYCPQAELWTFTRLDSIATGCALALMVQNDSVRRAFRKCPPVRTVMLLIALLSLSLGLSYSAGYAVGLAFTVNAVLIALLLAILVIHSECGLTKLADQKWLTVVGAHSYSLYLWQQLFLVRGKSGGIYDFPVNLLLVFVAAAISYRFIEQPFLKMKWRFETG